MNHELYLSFLKATRDVFEMMLEVDNLEENSGGLTEEDKLSIVIPVTGGLTGEIVYRFPKKTSLNMVKIMSGGMDFTEVDDFVTSAVSEIANIISGKALIDLSEKQIACDILPPYILIEDKPSEKSAEWNAITRVRSSLGDVEIDIRLAA